MIESLGDNGVDDDDDERGGDDNNNITDDCLSENENRETGCPRSQDSVAGNFNEWMS